MHNRNGDEPYHSTADASGACSETATAIAARTLGDTVAVIAPYGIDDLIVLVVRPTPAFVGNLDIHRKRVASKDWVRRWPRLTFITFDVLDGPSRQRLPGSLQTGPDVHEIGTDEDDPKRSKMASTGILPQPPRDSGNELFPGGPFADHNQWRPICRMRLLRLALVNQREHGLAHGFGAAHRLARRKAAHRASDELHGRIGVHLPMRERKRAGLRVNEGAGEAR